MGKGRADACGEKGEKCEKEEKEEGQGGTMKVDTLAPLGLSLAQVENHRKPRILGGFKVAHCHVADITKIKRNVRRYLRLEDMGPPLAHFRETLDGNETIVSGHDITILLPLDIRKK